MPESSPPNPLIRISERAILIFLVLKQVWIDRPRRDAITGGEAFDFLCVVHPVWAIPQYMERDRWADSGQKMDLPGITEFFLSRGGSRSLSELTKPRAGVGETPRWKFDTKGF